MHSSLEDIGRALAPLDPDGPELARKAQAARAFLRSAAVAAGPERVVVAWTGGKDSTIALALWREVLAQLAPGARPRALSLDTGCKFPEVLAFRDHVAEQWDVDLTVVRPDVDLDGYPLAVDKVVCCRDLKVRPLARAVRELDAAVLLTGIRADEHASRAARPAVEAHDAPPHLRLAPLLHFTEMDVWSFTMDEGLPFCPLYLRGYRSLGCMPCTEPGGVDGAERAGRARGKEASLAALHSLGYF